MTRIGRDLPPRPQREVVPELGLRSDFTSALSWGWDRAEVKPACAGTEWTAKREGWSTTHRRRRSAVTAAGMTGNNVGSGNQGQALVQSGRRTAFRLGPLEMHLWFKHLVQFGQISNKFS